MFETCLERKVSHLKSKQKFCFFLRIRIWNRMCGVWNESFHFGIRKRSVILTIGSCVIQQNNYDEYAVVTLIIPNGKNGNGFCVRVHHRNRRFVANRILLIELEEIQMLGIGSHILFWSKLSEWIWFENCFYMAHGRICGSCLKWENSLQ